MLCLVIISAFVTFVALHVSKKIEVLIPGHSSYYVSVAEAKQLTASNQAIWQGARRLVRSADVSKRGLWEKRQSGLAGPMVLQLT